MGAQDRMASVGGTISPEGIAILLEKLSNYWSKDKNAICLSLSLTYQSVANWYDSIVKTFAPEIARFSQGDSAQKRSHEEITKALLYTLSRNDGELASSSCDFLSQIERRYKNGELRKIVDRLDIDKVRLLRNKVVEFNERAMGGESRHQNKILYKPAAEVEEANVIMNWIMELDAYREMIRQYVSAIHNQLGCQKESLDMLRKKLESS